MHTQEYETDIQNEALKYNVLGEAAINPMAQIHLGIGNIHTCSWDTKISHRI